MLSTRKVTTLELGLYERMVPLVGGYLEAFARTDSELASAYTFEKHALTVRTPREQLLRLMVDADSDIYAMSCYVWNVGLVTSLARELMQALPRARVVLGGPQIIRHTAKYVSPESDRVIVCNGEGERTFADCLRELTESRPDMAKVNGISFYRDGELVTTPDQERLSELDRMPSPFLSGLFKGQYGTTVFETNRGCPYRCGFCFWGAATNDRVFKFSEDRIRDELFWISKQGLIFVFIADANWGMLGRDVAFSRHIAECKAKHRTPHMVYFSAAKNSPDRVSEISEIFQEAGIMAAQPVSLQTVDDEALKAVDRQNIKRSAYLKVQDNLNELGMSSYTELIWPLPAETLASFKRGISQICAMRCPTIIVYPHLLLLNTSIYNTRGQRNFVTRRFDDGIGDAEIVVATDDVTEEEFEIGMWLYYAMYIAYNARGLWAVSRYLNKRGVLPSGELFDRFGAFCRSQSYPISEFLQASVRRADFYDTFNYGKVAHHALHEHRYSTDALIFDFMRAQPFWDDEAVRLLFEFDRLNRPYIYSTVPPSSAAGERPFELLQVSDLGPRRRRVDVPARWLPLLAEHTSVPVSAGGSFIVDHHRKQFPYLSSQTLDQNAGYCYGMILRIELMVPQWTPIDGEVGHV